MTQSNLNVVPLSHFAKLFPLQDWEGEMTNASRVPYGICVSSIAADG